MVEPGQVNRRLPEILHPGRIFSTLIRVRITGHSRNIFWMQGFRHQIPMNI